MAHHDKESQDSSYVKHVHEILVCEDSEDSIFRVKREDGASEKVPESDKVESVEEVVEKHVCETRHAWHFHVLVHVHRTDWGDDCAAISEDEPFPGLGSEVATSLVVDNDGEGDGVGTDQNHANKSEEASSDLELVDFLSFLHFDQYHKEDFQAAKTKGVVHGCKFTCVDEEPEPNTEMDSAHEDGFEFLDS